MGQTVYVDLFFLINFSMDFLCFFLTSKLLSRPLSPARGILGAAFGGIYSNIALFLNFGQIWSLALDLLACAAMCAIVFGERKRARSLPLYILVFWAISMTLGGIMTALFNLFNRIAIFDEVTQMESDGISVWVFALLAALSGVITLMGGSFFRRRTAQSRATVELCYGGKRIRLQAMADSGNLLRDPLSGKPCVIADIEAVSALLPKDIVMAAREGGGRLDKIEMKNAKNVRLIPADTVSGKGMLIGVRVEGITVDVGGKSHGVDAIIALAELDGRADGNDALLPSGLLV